MEVMLRSHVENLGKRGDVVRVANGFARNYLIPKKLAYPVSDGVKKQVEIEARARSARDDRESAAAEQVLKKIEELQVLRFERKAGDHGLLFGSVTNADVAEALAGRGVDIDKRDVRLDEAIKRVGTHHVKIHVYREMDVSLAVEVEPEGETAEDA